MTESLPEAALQDLVVGSTFYAFLFFVPVHLVQKCIVRSEHLDFAEEKPESWSMLGWYANLAVEVFWWPTPEQDLCFVEVHYSQISPSSLKKRRTETHPAGKHWHIKQVFAQYRQALLVFEASVTRQQAREELPMNKRCIKRVDSTAC